MIHRRTAARHLDWSLLEQPRPEIRVVNVRRFELNGWAWLWMTTVVFVGGAVVLGLLSR